MEWLDWREWRPSRLTKWATRGLAEGAVIGFPGEGGMLAVCSAAHVNRLEGVASVVLAGAGAVRDWATTLGEAGLRITGRLWPGPVVLATSEGTERGLARRLTWERVAQDGVVQLRLASHPSLHAVVVASRVPLVCAESAQADVAIVDAEMPQISPATVMRADGVNYSVQRAGAMNEATLRERLARVIVFVCTGNTCRSPMSEAIFKALLAARLGCSIEELPLRGWVIASAGLAASPGMPAAREAVEVIGKSLARHRSQPLTVELAERADLLVGMTGGHVGAMRGLPARLLCPDGEDVDDPIGQPLEAYRACARHLEAKLLKLVEQLCAG